MSSGLPTLGQFHITDTGPEVYDPAALKQSPRKWVDAVMPGGVIESLIKAGTVPHPYQADHESKIRWIEDTTWWYHTEVEFPASQRPWQLTLNGIDTVADVWLGDTHLGRHENQFLPMRVTIPPNPMPYKDDLFLRFSPPLEGLEEPKQVRHMVDQVAVFLAAAAPADAEPETASGILTLNLAATRRRKAMLSWGWDFAPRVPSVGLSGPAEIAPTASVQIHRCAVHTTHLDLDTATANVEVMVNLDLAPSARVLSSQVSLISPTGKCTQVNATVHGDSIHADLDLTEVKAWWTHDLGEPNLYDLMIHLDLAGGDTVTYTRQIGIRTIELDESRDEDPAIDLPADHFRIILNGVPTFCRGANLVPLSMLMGSVGPEEEAKLVDLACRANMTMIRVWGGGTYASDTFLDACDRCGILIWHDFMFACIDYPCDDPHFIAEVRHEAEEVTARMAHHPSIGLWAGNNEVHAMHQAVHGSLENGQWGSEIFHEILPTAVHKNCPGAIYWPGSPWTNVSTDPRVNGTRAGDRHAWEVWHGADVGAGTHETYPTPAHAMHFHRYQYDTGRFISEFGIHASADLSTLRRWLGDEHLDLDDPVLAGRNKDVPADKGKALVELEAGHPHDLRSYVCYSQVVQAEGIKYGVEHYRRREPHCSGTLLWQLNEPWPGMTWSLIDHDLGAKPGYYAARHAFAPILASLHHNTDQLELWICNSTAHSVEATASVELVNLIDPAQDTNLSGTICASVPANCSKLVWSHPASQTPIDGTHMLWVSSPNGSFSDNRLLLSRVKDLNLPDPHLTKTVSPTGPRSATVQIHSDVFSYFVRVHTPWPGVVADEGAFDLRAGASRVVHLSDLPLGFDPSQISISDFASDRGDVKTTQSR